MQHSNYLLIILVVYFTRVCFSVYLFLGEEWEWMGFMQAAETEGLLDKGEYLVVALNFVTFKDKWAKDGLLCKYTTRKRGQSGQADRGKLFKAGIHSTALLDHLK